MAGSLQSSEHLSEQIVDHSTYVERSICAVDASANDFTLMHEHAAHGRLVGCECEIGHFDGLAHEDFVVFAVGDGTEDHDCG